MAALRLPTPKRLSPTRCLPTRFCFCLPTRFFRLLVRLVVIFAVLLGISVLYLRHACLLGGYPGVYGGSCYKKQNFVTSELESYPHAVPLPPPNVHVVMASTSSERRVGKTNWATPSSIAMLLGLPKGNVQVKKYVADDGGAEFHPTVNKGHEVGMYLTYILAYYDALPDIIIFLHAEEYAWHVDPMLLGSTSYLLSRLDLQQVKAREFVNLRVSWREGCPAWINTTVKDSTKKEEPFMKQAWADNFLPSGAAHKDAPEILAAPCCNQFAVTREAILRNKKSQYQRHVGWLQTTPLDDYMAGRVWERLFQFLFTGRAVDCPIQRKAYCSLYHICLNEGDWAEYVAAEDEDLEMRRAVRNVWSVLWKPFWGWGYTRRLATVGDKMSLLRQKGLIQGKSLEVVNGTGDIYTE